jgi:hypothetical protein
MVLYQQNVMPAQARIQKSLKNAGFPFARE